MPLLETIERLRREVDELVGAALPAARTESDLVGLLASIEGAVAGALERGRGRGASPPACAPGCAACCTVNVGTLGAEGAAAAALLRARLEPGEVSAVAARLAAFHHRIRWLEDRERIAARATCPLLDDRGRCTIHPVRPLACRGVSSLAADDCRRALADSAADEGDPPVVRMDLLQRALYGEAHAALAEGLARHGLDARPRDVTGMTAAFLADAGLAPAFLSGARLPVE